MAKSKNDKGCDGLIVITQDYLPLGCSKRTGKKHSMEGITIHSTGNPNSTAKNERRYLQNPANTNSVAWHLVIDETECIQAMPLNEVAIHAQNGSYKTFGIEICESGDREKTVDRTAELTAQLLKEYNWTLKNLYRHEDWYQKGCPGIFKMNNWAGWISFKNKVEYYLNIMSTELNKTPDYVRIKTTDPKGLKVRKHPDSNSELIKTLSNGEIVPIKGESGNFFKIQEGYIFKSYTESVDAHLSNKLAPLFYLRDEYGISFDLLEWTKRINEPLEVWAFFTFLERILKK